MMDRIASIAASALIVLGITALTLPGRGEEASKGIRAGGDAIANIANSLIGRH